MSTAPQEYSIRIGKKVLALIREELQANPREPHLKHLSFHKARSNKGPVYVEAGLADPSKHHGAMGLILAVKGGDEFTQTQQSWLEGKEHPADISTASEIPFCIRVLVGQRKDNELEVAAQYRESPGTDWQNVDHIFLEAEPGAYVWRTGRPPVAEPIPPERVARFTSSFGEQAWQRLRRSTAVVIGAGGTGSIAIPMLARAGVGKIVIVDSDHITASNLERTHAAFPEHVEKKTLKAELARDHVRSIDPDIDVIAFEGRLPQPEIVAEVARADVILGCTDQHTSRLAVADMSRRYLVPAIDCGGLIEGGNGRVTGQIIQLVVFRPDDPCPICRGMIDPLRVKQELFSEEERKALIDADTKPPEAHEIPQIDTVGYITTISGTLAAGYAIGWLTGRFEAPFERMQMNLIADCLDITNRPQNHSEDCQCRQARGLADDGIALAPFEPPAHWKSARLIE